MFLERVMMSVSCVVLSATDRACSIRAVYLQSLGLSFIQRVIYMGNNSIGGRACLRSGRADVAP